MNSTDQRKEWMMCRFFIILAAVLLAVTMCPLTAQAGEIEDQLAAGSYVEGEAIAAIRTGARQMQARADSPFEVTELVSVDSSAVQEESQAPQTQGWSFFSVRDAVPLSDGIDLCVVSSDTLSTEELLRRLTEDPDVVFAEPNYIFELNGRHPSGEAALAAAEDQAGVSTAQPETVLPGDLTCLQWGNWSTDQTARAPGMTANPSINVPDFGPTGSNMDKPVTVALLDTGVYYQHPDLQNVLYHFTPEQQEALGCWEWGYNAVGQGIHGDKPDEASIAYGHGTHTAGIIGAEWNGSGTSGVASNVRIVSITLADGDGNESMADALAAFAFVDRFNRLVPKDERIVITSNSWSEFSSSRALDAVLRDLGERWGIVSVFSSGNDSKNNDRYEKTPSSHADNPYVIIVANTTTNDTFCSSSEYGVGTVDLGAPGTNILSTTAPERGIYCPDALPDDNLIYLGFDGEDALPVKVSQVYREGNPKIYEDEEIVRENVSATTEQAHFSGTGCLKIEVDPQYVVEEAGWLTESQSYDLQFDIDLEGTDIGSRLEGMKDLRLAFVTASEEGSSSVLRMASTNAALITEKQSEDGESVTRPVALHIMSTTDTAGGQWGHSDFLITRDMFINSEYNEGLDPNVPAVDPGETLSIKLRVSLPKGCTTFYIDAIGLGTQTVPYEYATGTSMACPAVSGAAAVLASQGHEGLELASLVRSMVRIPDSGPLEVRTGGVFDFTVTGSPNGGGDASPLAPAISSVTARGSSIIVTGSNFGAQQGSVDVSRYTVGADLQPVTAQITSWADNKVTLASEEPLQGILQIVLTNAGGKYDTRMCFAGRGETVYEKDLPFDTSTGKSDVFGDGVGDWETRGPLVGLGGKLYYLPAYCGQSTDYHVYRSLRCFDLRTRTWAELPELPEWLLDASAVLYDGKLVVEGSTVYMTEWNEPTGKFPEGETGKERVYVYDPGSKEWTKASSEGMQLGQTILNDGGQLKLAGSVLPDPDNPYADGEPVPLMAYDLEKGAGDKLCDLPAGFTNPAAAAKDGTILLYSAASDCAFIRIQDGQAALLENAAPEFFLAEGDEPKDGSWGNVMQYPYLGVLAPVSDGFVLVGPPETGGASDTYLLRDGKDKFEAYDKRSTDDRAYSQAACTYKDQLFVIASAWFEPETRLFRATAMEVPEYPGDVSSQETPAHSGGGGSSTPASKPVNLSSTVAFGSAVSSASSARVGETVTITVKPDEGYQVAAVTVTDANGNPVAAKDNGDGTWSFTMPGTAVSVNPVFTKAAPSTESGSCPRDNTCPMTPFTDTDKTKWYHDGVHWALEKGVMNGTGDDTFEPMTATSRAMLVTMLWRMEGSPAVDDQMTFRDVPDGKWYTDAIRWAAAKGIVNGYDKDTFGVNDPVTREQLAAILYRTAQDKGLGFTGAWSFPLAFEDADQISEYAYEAMCWMNMNGVINGMSDKVLSPQSDASRAQVAAMLMRFSEKVK